jgi:glycosyltransferase involved in cell wall biosynthesis
MRVAYLTAGAGGMYCGSCMHDNTLAAALLQQRRDVVLLPVFTPTRTDETDVSRQSVHYGGINVYLQQRSGFFRRLPRFLDRWLDSPRLLRFLVRTPKGADDLVGALTVSVLEGEAGAQKKELERLVHYLEHIEPQLVVLPNAMFVGIASELKRRLGVAVVCNLSGEDLFLESLGEPHRSRALDLVREGARQVDAFVASNRYYADHCRELFEISGERVHVVPLGIKVDDLEARGSAAPGDPFTIGFLARICPEKGLHLLAQAFEILASEGRDCRLLAGGYLSPAAKGYVEDIGRRLGARGLHARFELRPDVDRHGKRELLRSMDVLSVPTEYRESKGLYLLEAGAAGLPVVQPRHGCFPEHVESTGGGLLFEPGDVKGLAAGLARLMDDAALRRELGDKGRAAILAGSTDRHMAEKSWDLYERCLRSQNEPVASRGRPSS